METIDPSKLSHFTEEMATDERSYGKVREKHDRRVFGNLKILLAIFNLKEKNKMKCQNDWNDILRKMIHILITKLHKSNKELLTVMLLVQFERQVIAGKN